MPANCSGTRVGILAERYRQSEVRLGWLYNALTDAGRMILPEMPWALDCGTFPAWSKGECWRHRAFYDGMDRLHPRWLSAMHRPRFVVVPDWPTDRERTLRRWAAHAPRVQRYGLPLAFAVQDGMTPADVPPEAEVVFVGGSTEWKWRTVPTWCAAFPRVHVGRVNSYSALRTAAEAGAESCDGTGWFRGDQRQLAGLLTFLRERAGPGTCPDWGRRSRDSRPSAHEGA